LINGLFQLFGRSDIGRDGFHRAIQGNIFFKLFEQIGKMNVIQSRNSPWMMEGALFLTGKSRRLIEPSTTVRAG